MHTARSVLIGTTPVQDQANYPPAPPKRGSRASEPEAGFSPASLPVLGVPDGTEPLPPVNFAMSPGRLGLRAAQEMGRFWAHLGRPTVRTDGYNPTLDLPPDEPYDANEGRRPRQRRLRLAALTKQAESQRAQRALRVRLIGHYGGRCRDCGIVGPPAIYQFDHRDPDTKLRNVSACRTWEEALAEAEKCDLVCCNCHAIRTHADTARIQAKIARTRAAKRSTSA